MEGKNHKGNRMESRRVRREGLPASQKFGDRNELGGFRGQRVKGE